MKLRLLQFYETVKNSFWFLPSAMAILAAVAALGSVALDHAWGSDWVRNIGWVWAGSASGARSVLSTVAGSVMTVVSVVFSITVTALAFASGQFGPRVLRNFTADRGNQFVLGTFIATFVYCLLVLRTVRSVEETGFVPYLSVNLGMALAVASLAVLIYFIHHVSQSIQVENLVAAIGDDFCEMLPRVFPENIGHDRENLNDIGDDEPLLKDETWNCARVIDARSEGYIQRVDDARLMKFAIEHDVVLKLEKRPGDFLTRDATLMRVLASEQTGQTGPQLERELQECFYVGAHRTAQQDAAYPIQQLVEIALRALSPGVNEPFTALACIDRLGSSLQSVARRRIPSPLRRDQNGVLRIVAHPVTFDELAKNAFAPIRLYGKTNPEISVRLLDAIGDLAPHLWREDDFESLIEHADRIAHDAKSALDSLDGERIQKHLEKALRALAQARAAQKS
jgi:uncharacterized membrane protein